MLEFYFATVVLATWSISDNITGHVNNLALLIPTIITALFFPMKFIAVFVPLFIVLSSLWLIFKKRGLIGFADVIGLPFCMFYVMRLNIFGVIIFVGAFSFMLMLMARAQYDKVLKRKVYDQIRLMPILFLSFIVAALTHLIFGLLF